GPLVQETVVRGEGQIVSDVDCKHRRPPPEQRPSGEAQHARQPGQGGRWIDGDQRQHALHAISSLDWFLKLRGTVGYRSAPAGLSAGGRPWRTAYSISPRDRPISASMRSSSRSRTEVSRRMRTVFLIPAIERRSASAGKANQDRAMVGFAAGAGKSMIVLLMA